MPQLIHNAALLQRRKGWRESVREIAHGIIFLIENEFTTGTHLYIDGGYTAQ